MTAAPTMERRNKMADKHPCKGDYLDKFIQPAILSLLTEHAAHGFYLLEELERRGLVSNADAAGFYRTLRRLEQDGKLTAEWEVGGGEKPRKIYTITEKGVRCLQNWQKTLHDYIHLVQRISLAVDGALGEGRAT